MVKPLDHTIVVNGIHLHYIEYAGDGPVLLMMHGLTANGHAFDGLAKAGLVHNFRMICPDLRGRGLTDKTPFRYTFEDHAQDMLGLIAHLGKEKVVLCGHSFGGYLGFYMAANYPEVAEKLVIMDAAKTMNPNAAEMLGDAIARLDSTYPSFDKYIEVVKKAPYLDFWDDAMLGYYRADVKDNPDGSVTSHTSIADIGMISYNTANIDWEYYITRVTAPALLINGLDNYNLGEPLLPDEIARETVEMMHDAKYVPVDGNHQTMLYGNGANEIVKAINKFVDI